jgi:Protein of unknown function (DUF3228)
MQVKGSLRSLHSFVSRRSSFSVSLLLSPLVQPRRHFRALQNRCGSGLLRRITQERFATPIAPVDHILTKSLRSTLAFFTVHSQPTPPHRRLLHHARKMSSSASASASAAAVAAAAATTPEPAFLQVDGFALRQFKQSPLFKDHASCPIDFDPQEFEAKINSIWQEGKSQLVDGYAPFCKHIFVPNFVGAQVPVMEITADNEHLIRTKYVARTDKELPVLTRFFPADHPDVSAPDAKFLDLILYSREQITKENAAMGKEDNGTSPWGVISVKPSLVDYELPMNPITVMRNALGVEHGGSGKELIREEYMKSVEYWSKHAMIS